MNGSRTNKQAIACFFVGVALDDFPEDFFFCGGQR